MGVIYDDPWPCHGPSYNKIRLNSLESKLSDDSEFFFVGDPLGISCGGFGWSCEMGKLLVCR